MERSAIPGSSNSSYAFITHSQDTLPKNLPPDIDNATLARRRRRRTSPRDQAILEEEYKKCDRPDKTRRKEITRMVQMGEKEVQIWFQNRRQSVKRRSMPLPGPEFFPGASAFGSSQSLPSDEICEEQSTLIVSSSPGSAGSRSVVSAANGVSSSSSAANSSSPSRAAPADLPTQPTGPNVCNASKTQTQLQESIEPIESTALPTQTASSQSSEIASAHGAPTRPLGSQGSSADGASIQETKMTTSAHNRLQDVLSRVTQPSSSSRRTAPSSTSTNHAAAPPRLLKRSSSIRLSSSEGKAIVVLDDPLPSPPHQQASARPPQQPAFTTSCPSKRKLVDSKVWEFWCDNQSVIRSPGETPAEATQALRLIRTKSNNALNRMVDPTPQKQKKSSSTEKQHKKPLHPRTPNEKAKTSRKVITSKSAKPKPLSNKQPFPQQQQAADGDKFSIFEPGQESDKENRPPGAPVSPPPEPKRRPGMSGRGTVQPGSTKKQRAGGLPSPRKVLGESKSIPSQSSSASVFYDIPQPLLGVDIYEEPAGTQDSGYIASQESNERDSQPSGSQTSISDDRRVDELECVENLLSLKGGSWR